MVVWGVLGKSKSKEIKLSFQYSVHLALFEKFWCSEFFCSVFYPIRIDSEILRISPYSVRMWKIQTRKTPNTGTFYAVQGITFLLFNDLPVVSIKYNLGKTFSRNERLTHLTLSWRRPLSYRNQSIDLLTASVMKGLTLMAHFIGIDFCCESVDWFLFEWLLALDGLVAYSVEWFAKHFEK